MRDDFKLMKIKYNTIQYGLKSLPCQDAPLWNSIPVNVKYAKSNAEFKRSLSQCYVLKEFQCGSCLLCRMVNI